jgi:hypothetical protein
MGRKAGGLGSLSLAPGQFFIGGTFFHSGGNSISIWRVVIFDLAATRQGAVEAVP